MSSRKLFSSPQNCPCNPGQFVGERDDRDITMNASEQFLQPSPEPRIAFGEMRQRGPRPVGQLFAQVGVPPFADPEQFGPSAGCCLPWNKT